MTTVQEPLAEPGDTKKHNARKFYVYRATFPPPNVDFKKLSIELVEFLPYLVDQAQLRAAAFEMKDDRPSAILLQADTKYKLKQAFAKLFEHLIDAAKIQGWLPKWSSNQLSDDEDAFANSEDFLDLYDEVYEASLVTSTDRTFKARLDTYKKKRARENGLVDDEKPSKALRVQQQRLVYKPFVKEIRWQGFGYDDQWDRDDTATHRKALTFLSGRDIPFYWNYAIMVEVVEYCREVDPTFAYKRADHVELALALNKTEEIMPNMPNWSIYMTHGYRNWHRKLISKTPDMKKLPPFPADRDEEMDANHSDKKDPRRDALALIYQRNVSPSEVMQLIEKDELFDQYLYEICRLVSFRRTVYGYLWTEGQALTNGENPPEDVDALRNLSDHIEKATRGAPHPRLAEVARLRRDPAHFQDFFNKRLAAYRRS